jgi:hypothetical protein
VEKAYPELPKFVPECTSARDSHNPPGYFMHMEPIMLAWEYAKENRKISADASVFVFEDDVFFCGDKNPLSDLLHHYPPGSFDFLSLQNTSGLTGNWGPRAKWPHWECVSPAFGERYKKVQRRMSAEFFEGWSTKLLEHIKALYARGIHALSEMFSPTVCHNDGFQCRVFQPNHLGKLLTTAKVKFLNTSQEAATICAGDRNGTTVNHAAKFLSI